VTVMENIAHAEKVQDSFKNHKRHYKEQ